MEQTAVEQGKDESTNMLLKFLMIAGAALVMAAGHALRSILHGWMPFVVLELGNSFGSSIRGITAVQSAVTVFSLILMAVTGRLADRKKKHLELLAFSLFLSAGAAILYHKAWDVPLLQLSDALLICSQAMALPLLWHFLLKSLPFRRFPATTIAIPLAIHGGINILTPLLRLVMADNLQANSIYVAAGYILLAGAGLAMVRLARIRLARGETNAASADSMEPQQGIGLRKLILLFLALEGGISVIGILATYEGFMSIGSLAFFQVTSVIQMLAPFLYLGGGLMADACQWGAKRYFRIETGYLYYFLPGLLIYLFMGILFAFADPNLIAVTVMDTLLTDLLAAAVLAAVYVHFPQEKSATWIGVVLGARQFLWLVTSTLLHSVVALVTIGLTLMILLYVLWKDWKGRGAGTDFYRKGIRDETGNHR